MRSITNASLYRTDGYRTIVSLQSGPVEITEAEIIQGSMTLDSSMSEGETFEIGNAISDQLMLTLDNSNGTYTSAFVGVEFDLYIAPFPVDGSVSRENASWSQIGTFVCTQCDTSYADRITLTLNDRFVLLDQKIPAGTFSTSRTLYQHLSSFCTTLGIGLELSNTEQTFLSGISVVAPSSSSAWFAGMTYRDFVRGIAGIMWENAKMTASGDLAFRQSRASSITTTPSNRYNSQKQEVVYIGSLNLINLQGSTVYTTGSGDGQRLVLDESENKVVQLIGPTMLAGYYGTLTVPGADIIDTSYVPMNVTCLPFWEAECGDNIVYIDKDENIHVGIITSLGGVINGAMSITSAGESEQHSFQYIGKLTDSEQTTMHIINEQDNKISNMEPIVSGFSASINELEDRILSSVGSAYIKYDDFGGRFYEEFSTAIEQTDQSVTFLLDNRVTMTDVNGAVNDLSKSIEKYIRLTTNGVEIGEEGNSLVLRLDNDEIGFYKDGLKVAYWDGQTLHTGDAYIELNHQFRLGNFAAFPRSTGGVSWLKVSD